MIKYLYSLVSDASDFYLEQTLLSATSLRLQMPNAFISLLADDITAASLTGKRAEILKLVDEFKSVKIDKCFNKVARSRWLKTSMRRLIEGDFLYIDNDTIISDNLSSITDTEAELGAVLDDHTYISEYKKFRPKRLRDIQKLFKKCRFDSPFEYKTYFNGGIFFCKDCKAGHDFFNQWHSLWLHCHDLNILTDMQSLNQANYNMGNIIKELDGIWNCQLMHDGALKHFYNAKIIHYFATHVHDKPFLFANRECLESIKESGTINQGIMDMLKTPKTQFASSARIFLIDDTLREFYDSATFGAAKRIYYTVFGKIVEMIFSKIKKNVFTPLRKKLYNKRK